jgi:signal transduction histidine kinase
MLDHRRIEVPQSNVRAIHFIRRTALRPESSPRLAQIAEQLREPLASIYGFTELLIHQNYDEVTRLELTSTMLGEIEVMMDLINRQLDLTQDPL